MTETGKHVLTQNPYNLIWDSINPYEFTGKFSLHVLDLSYISKVTDDIKNTSLYHWACLFKATTWKEMLAMAEQSESIRKAVVTLRQLTNDEKIKLQCEARERYRMDDLDRALKDVSYREQLIHELHIAPDDSISQ